MTIQQVIDRILAYHPGIGEREAITCDTLKCGDPNAECTGIVTTCTPTVAVIRKAAELGYNLIIPHEPTFYSHMDETDWLIGRIDVYDEKRKLLDDNGIAVWRDHDHIHAHRPDGIFTGVVKKLGWENYVVGSTDDPMHFELPQTTVRELAKFLKETLHLNAVRVVGNVDAACSKVAFAGHIYSDIKDSKFTELLDQADVIIPGEMIDWTTASYARDAAQLGKNKAILQIGHFNWEEPGMEYAPVWLHNILGPDVPIQFIASGDPYQYVL